MKLGFARVFFLASFGFGISANAAVVISNLNNTTTFNVSANVTNGVWPSQGFSTDSQAYSLDQITVLLQSTNNADTSAPLEVALYSDNAGLPGSQIGVLAGEQFPNPSPLNTRTPFVFTPTVALLLDGSTDYHIVLRTSGDGFYNWSLPLFADVNLEGPGAVGNRGSSTDQGGSWSSVTADKLYFSVEGSPIPEPSSALIAFSGLFGLILVRRR